jgi:hypothetical protein
MSEDVPENNDYEIGYKRPPKSGQFKKGQSGNQTGSSNAVRSRKAKKTTFGNLFTEGMQLPVEVEEGGKKIVLTRMHLAIRRRAEEAAKGNMPALKELLKLRDVKEAGHWSRASGLSLRSTKCVVLARSDMGSIAPTS